MIWMRSSRNGSTSHIMASLSEFQVWRIPSRTQIQKSLSMGNRTHWVFFQTQPATTTFIRCKNRLSAGPVERSELRPPNQGQWGEAQTGNGITVSPQGPSQKGLKSGAIPKQI